MQLFALTSLPLAALLLGACNALPANSVVLEKIESSPTGWTLDPAANEEKARTTLTLKIHLVNQGMNDFHKLALDVRKRCALR
jgi:tripeptidyl-peptidase-1